MPKWLLLPEPYTTRPVFNWTKTAWYSGPKSGGKFPSLYNDRANSYCRPCDCLFTNQSSITYKVSILGGRIPNTEFILFKADRGEQPETLVNALFHESFWGFLK